MLSSRVPRDIFPAASGPLQTVFAPVFSGEKFWHAPTIKTDLSYTYNLSDLRVDAQHFKKGLTIRAWPVRNGLFVRDGRLHRF